MPLHATQPFPHLWNILKVAFPELEELIVILYPNLEKANTLEELVEVDKKDIEEETIKDDVQRQQLDYMDRVRDTLRDGESRGLIGPLKLTFMKISVERHRRLCETCGHVIYRPGPRVRGEVHSPNYFGGRFCWDCYDRKWKLLKEIRSSECGLDKRRDRYWEAYGETLEDPENPTWWISRRVPQSLWRH